MNKIFILIIVSFLSFNSFSQATFCDNFETYNPGDFIAESSSNWETWASVMAPCPTTPCADDANIVVGPVDTNGVSSNVLHLIDNSGSGGPGDIILPFSSGNYTTGEIILETDIYVTTSAYLNIQAETVVGQGIGVWAIDIQMDNLGNIQIDNGGGAVVFLTSTFPQQQWFQFKLQVDLTLNIWEVFINNQSIGTFSNPTNKISSLNLYPTVGNDYYVDNICYEYIPFIPLDYDMTAVELDMNTNLVLSNAPYTVSGKLVSLSANPVTSLDVNYSIDGGSPVTYNVSGINLNLFDTLSFNHNTIWNPALTGSYVIEIWASNINNGNIDMNINNDILSDTIHIWNAVAIRMPLIETFTSSTCGPCAPANVTAEALFNQNIGKLTSIKYQVDFPGTGDPYHTLEGGNRRSYYAINSVPRMEIDGGWDQNGNNITQQVLDDHIDVLTFVEMSATYSINIKTIEVDVTIDPLEDVQSNNLVVHAAIIEKTTYKNVKTNGETQFEHVVKKMMPNENGTTINGLSSGQQVTLNLNYTFKGEYRLPANALNPINHTIEHSVEDFGNLMVVVWLQDVATKKVHQSAYASLAGYIPISYNCVNNACVDPLDGTGTYSATTSSTPLLDCEAICLSTLLEEENKKQLVFPNPATDNIYISNIKENAIIKIYDVKGKEVLDINIIDKQRINISHLSKGVYQIKIQGKDWLETRKLIIE